MVGVRGKYQINPLYRFRSLGRCCVLFGRIWVVLVCLHRMVDEVLKGAYEVGRAGTLIERDGDFVDEFVEVGPRSLKGLEVATALFGV